MKNIKYFIFILVFIFLTILALVNILHVKARKSETEFQPSSERNGTAIIITGAAARIPQEAALLEQLHNRGLLNDVVFISGVSSGALNSVVLNGILSKKISWTEYRNILFGIENKDIFIQEGKKLPVNTDPARNLYKRVIEDRLGYYEIGQLPVMTAISFTHLSDLDLKKTVYRMCSKKINRESDTTLSLVDIIMASTAFPIAFPPARIKNAKTIPDVEYIDGGIGEDHVPFKALLDFEKYRGMEVDKIFIISRKSDNLPEVSEELRVLGINDNGIFDRMDISMDNILKKGIIKRLKTYSEVAPDHVDRTYIWIPEFNANFLMFSFNNLKEQYELTTKWAKTHYPVPLKEFLSENSK